MFTTDVVILALGARESHVLQAFSNNKFIYCAHFRGHRTGGHYYVNLRCSCERVMEEVWFTTMPDTFKLHELDILSYVEPTRCARETENIDVLAMQVPERWMMF